MKYEIAALVTFFFALFLGAIYTRVFDFSDTTEQHPLSYLLPALFFALATIVAVCAVPVLIVWGIVG